MTQKNRKAFTLIELLVVVAIIAILIAILMPSLGTARKQAASAKCLAGLRAIAQGTFMYAGDNSGFIPFLQDPDWSTSGYPAGTVIHRWNRVLTPYLTASVGMDDQTALATGDVAKVFRSCPSFDKRMIWPTITDPTDTSKTGYGYNAKPVLQATNSSATAANNDLYGPFPNLNGGGKTLGMKLATIDPAADRILFGDSVDYHLSVSRISGVYWFPPASWITPMPNSLYSSGDPSRHGAPTQDPKSGWANYSMADGHAESLKPTQARNVLMQLSR